jgi:hypothetical protein
MLKCKVTKRPDHTVFYAKAAGHNASALLESLVGLWSKVLDELEGLPVGTVWEILVVKFVTQCGSFFVYPACEATVETQVPSFRLI